MDGANANYVFEGAGSALSDGSAFFKKIGAVVYSYNPREVNIWYPGSEDYLLFVGGIWGYGSPTQASATASVSVKVIKTKATGSGITSLHALTTTTDQISLIVWFKSTR